MEDGSPLDKEFVFEKHGWPQRPKYRIRSSEKMEIHLSRGEFLRWNRDNGRNMGKADEIRAVSRAKGLTNASWIRLKESSVQPAHSRVSSFVLPLLNHGEMPRIFAEKQITLENATVNSSPVKSGSHE